MEADFIVIGGDSLFDDLPEGLLGSKAAMS